MVIWTFHQTRIIGLYQFGWNSGMSYRLVLPQVEIKLVLWNNFGHLGREYKGLRKKHVTPSHPKYKQRDSFHSATSLCQLQIAYCIGMLETWTSNITMNTDARILGVSYNFQVCPSRQWNLECEPQLETRKKPTSSFLPFSSEGWRVVLQSDPETDLLNYLLGSPRPWN